MLDLESAARVEEKRISRGVKLFPFAHCASDGVGTPPSQDLSPGLRRTYAARAPNRAAPHSCRSSGASVPDLTTETLAPARKQHSLKRVAAGAAARLGGVSP